MSSPNPGAVVTVQQSQQPQAIVFVTEHRSLQTTTNVYDMSSIAADALKAQAQSQADIARSTYEVPAQEKTKRAKEETKRGFAIGGCVVIGIIAIIYANSPEIAWPIATLCAVLAAVHQAGAAVAKLSEKK